MHDCTPNGFWQSTTTSLLPAVSALLSAIALWVASRARSTSKAAQSTSLAVGYRSGLLPERRAASGSRPGAPDRRKW